MYGGSGPGFSRALEEIIGEEGSNDEPPDEGEAIAPNVAGPLANE